MSAPATCAFCGRAFVQRGGRGRPRDYCSDDCREARKLLSRIDTHLGRLVAAGLTADAARRVRGNVWASLNVGLNGLARGTMAGAQVDDAAATDATDAAAAA